MVVVAVTGIASARGVARFVPIVVVAIVFVFVFVPVVIVPVVVIDPMVIIFMLFVFVLSEETGDGAGGVDRASNPGAGNEQAAKHDTREGGTGKDRESCIHVFSSNSSEVFVFSVAREASAKMGQRFEFSNVSGMWTRQNGAMHILLVEDQRRLAAAVRRVLEEENHVVDAVEDGADAFAQAVAEEYDLIVLDVMLPGLDGYEVARRLRKRGDTTPILMLTARDSVQDRVTGLDAGADDYLVKPFALAELLARVRALTRRAQMAVSEPGRLQVADLELDMRTREAIRQGRRIELTAREFALLETLMRHPGQVLTRSQLLDRVWSYDLLTESNVVDIYIHYLRNKIDRDFEPKLIRTVRGTGYALRNP